MTFIPKVENEQILILLDRDISNSFFVWAVSLLALLKLVGIPRILLVLVGHMTQGHVTSVWVMNGQG